MHFTKEEIINYADKLLIGLSEEEAKTILDEFDIIEANISQINEIPNLQEVEPAFMPYDLYVATLREDEAEESTDVDLILQNTKDKLGREIRVPKVVE
jgi:aspartyl/glutamyl-tRNA(Asn/Gln) amidotransferase C subunit